MQVIYENATKGDDPLPRVFTFDRPTRVVYNGKEFNVTNCTLKIKRKGMVYADNEPVSITAA